MATLLWQRSISSDVDSVKTTFSGWDSCMSKAYCKWPVIAGIIIGSLIIFSVVFCVLRCLCCGAEACCACLSCCSCCASCCNNGRHRSKGYAQPQPTPQLQPYPQYQSAPPPMYGVPQQPQYARFDAHGGARGGQEKYNEDALPAMPSWDTSKTTRTLDGNDVEMDRYAAAPMLPKSPAQSPYTGDIGMMSGPQYQETAYHRDSPAMSYSDPYAGYSGAQQSGTIRAGHYEPSVAPPPSYRTAPSTVASQPIGRKPVSGSWREV